jgi:hypothetical protein
MARMIISNARGADLDADIQIVIALDVETTLGELQKDGPEAFAEKARKALDERLAPLMAIPWRTKPPETFEAGPVACDMPIEVNSAL